ncbi:MAG TPA: DUF5667 domain-containing protein [Micromonosporaceae bacterium]
MSTPVFYRRRAERLAELLDGVDHRHHAVADKQLADLAALGQRIATIPPPGEIDPGFRTDLRAMLMATAAREGIGATAKTSDVDGRRTVDHSPRSRRARARTIVIAGVAAGAITVSGISAASENSLPGDALYGMKRTTERAQLALASGDERGQLHLELARTRLFEAQASQHDPKTVTALLDDMDTQTEAATKVLGTAAMERRDTRPLDTLATFAAEQRRQLTALRDATEGRERARVATSLSLVDAVGRRVDGLRAAVACGAGAAKADALGPVPDRCD